MQHMPTSFTLSPTELVENFALFDTWEDRYTYLLDLAKKMPPMSAQHKTDSHKVPGCVSQVWMVGKLTPEGRLYVEADADALLVRGLLAVVLALVNGRTPAEIQQLNLPQIFQQIGLHNHLSPSRRNGFAAMLAKINQLSASPVL